MNQNIIKILKEELERNYLKLRLEENPPPFFISYLYRKSSNYNVWGKYGDIFEDNTDNNTSVYVETRIGEPKFDNTISGGLYNNSTGEDSYRWITAPLDRSSDGLKHTLWRLTDLKYKEALIEYYQKKSQMIKEVIIHKAPLDFSCEKPSLFKKELTKFQIPKKEWENLIKKYSKIFRKYKYIDNSYLSLMARNTQKYYVDTEGSEVISEEILYGLNLTAHALAKDGMFLERSWNDSFAHLEEFPDDDCIREKIENIAQELDQLREAELLKPYTGPAILYPSAAGIFFHEAIGHRLEGERLLSPGEGQTFKGKIGNNILPEFISIYDDPVMKEFNGKSLAGHYLYDDEGIPGEKVVLIENGKLKNFLLSRAIVGDFSNSNGHGRSAYHEDPIARMANLFIKSSLEYDKDKLKELLVKEIKKHGNDFGLIIKEARSGETNTNRYNFQAFKGQPTMVYKVDPSSGNEILVRGADFIGTPLTSVQKVIATGKDYKAVNGFCGAESGFIPVSTIAPSILIKEVEMQRSNEINLTTPILPPPWYRRK